MRQHCQRLKVVSQPLNGAHLVLPPASSGEVTLAVRVYYTKDLPPSLKDKSQVVKALSEPSSLEEDLDGLLRFQQSFALTIVFFILTEDEKQKHLADMGSFVRRAMHQLTTSTFRASSSSSSSSKATKNLRKHTTTRILMVPSSEMAVQSLIHFANALTPTKRQLKQSFYEQRRQMNYLPPSTTSSSLAGTTPIHSATVASFVTNALRDWAAQQQIPEHEVDVLLQVLGSLEAIAEHTATGLTHVPIAPRTKALLHRLFHGRSSTLDDENGSVLEKGPTVPATTSHLMNTMPLSDIERSAVHTQGPSNYCPVPEMTSSYPMPPTVMQSLPQYVQQPPLPRQSYPQPQPQPYYSHPAPPVHLPAAAATTTPYRTTTTPNPTVVPNPVYYRNSNTYPTAQSTTPRPVEMAMHTGTDGMYHTSGYAPSQPPQRHVASAIPPNQYVHHHHNNNNNFPPQQPYPQGRYAYR